MSQVVIRVENLGKRYRIGERERYLTLRDILANSLEAPLRLFRRSAAGSTNHQPQYIWALKDVCFEIAEGEVVGIIGRNGAGKTTLLKILSRVTCPTEGYAEVRGRIGSLLEVGTGFHQELTGRENTYLSGAILGMSKKEIDAKFDSIISFAEIEPFIDTPVKHYSSGMYVRLAFAVAAHLEPDILLVDEVLAVGDAAFQKKCLGKMGDVARAGRTVLFVSHSIGAINALCSRTLLVNHGRVAMDGPTYEVTARYYAESVALAGNGSDLRARPRTGTGKAKFSRLSIQARNASGEDLAVAYPGCDLTIELEIESVTDILESNVSVIIYDLTGYRLIDVNTAQKGSFLSLRAGQKARARFHLRELLLKPGRYFVGLWLGRDYMEEIDHIEHATVLDIAESPETSKTVINFPGPYLCRFESSLICQ